MRKCPSFLLHPSLSFVFSVFFFSFLHSFFLSFPMSPRMLETSIYPHFSSLPRFLPALRQRTFSTSSLLPFPFSSIQRPPLFSNFFLSSLSSPSPLLSAFLRCYKKLPHAYRENQELQLTKAPSLWRNSSSKSYPCKTVLREESTCVLPPTQGLILLNYLLYHSPTCPTLSYFSSSLSHANSSSIFKSLFLHSILTYPWNAVGHHRREEEEINRENNRTNKKESCCRGGEDKTSRGGENKDEGDEKVSSSSVMWLRPRKKGMRIDRAKTKKQYKHRRHVGGWNYRWLGS
ncbi:transmembrane protein [Cystoisospora suis]|uniref:Transmembrane protein n=1 Tax=Cystoisospora suis TaxID=483139 RepID=A0A2C6L649_9APIC|nr:transmembrane protein [Cystoisospora suis]